MYAKLTAETKTLAAQSIGSQQRFIINRSSDPIDRGGNAGQTRSQYQLRAEIIQFTIVAFNTKVDTKIDAAKHQPADSRCCSQRSDLHKTSRAFNQRNHRARSGSDDACDLIQTSRLRQHQRCDAGMYAQCQIGCMPLRVGAIDTQGNGLIQRAARSQPISHRSACAIFVLHRDRIFQINDDHIGARGKRFVYPFRTVSGNKQISNRRRSGHSDCLFCVQGCNRCRVITQLGQNRFCVLSQCRYRVHACGPGVGHCWRQQGRQGPDW